MPSSDDYSNTIIYKISCRKPEITDLYIGHTVDFVRRKKQHIYACNNNNAIHLYDFIRTHGGWDNWEMNIIHHFSCTSLQEAVIIEQEFYERYGATLNSVQPHVDKEKKAKLAKKANVVIYTGSNQEFTYVEHSPTCWDKIFGCCFVCFTPGGKSNDTQSMSQSVV